MPMEIHPILKRYGHFFAYLLIITAVALLGRLYPPLLYPGSVLLMVAAPLIMEGGLKGLHWDSGSFLVGLCISALILVVYLVFVLRVLEGEGWHWLDRVLKHPEIVALIVLNMFVVAFSEEVFFRGYLQNKIGMNIRGVIIVSAMFAAAHFIVAVLGAGAVVGFSLKGLLTFFPSIVMGYMYVRLKTLWPSILFHFLSNLLYIGTGGL